MRIRQQVGQSILRVLAALLVAAVMALAFVFRDKLPDLAQAAYPAIFIVNLVGSASILLPLPAIGSVCVGGVALNPLVVGLVAGVGGSIGEITGYLLGFSGRGVLREGRMYLQLESWMRRRGWLLLFVLAALPTPLFDVAGFAAGALRLPLWRFYLAVWPGKTLKYLGVAYACALGYDVVKYIRGLPL